MATQQQKSKQQIIVENKDDEDYYDLYQNKCNQYEELIEATEKLEQAYAVLLNKKNKEIFKLKDELSHSIIEQQQKDDQIQALKKKLKQSEIDPNQNKTVNEIETSDSESSSAERIP
eukprot:CAMPEP_0201580542 /NCGR_PEP_ID=MMETSP0190_2-20130828/49580_1 /ASSEMBLY_ACC=CAM_ASM_000263 /TAXON_ID=37353 /ORGANISM="Rosalina sp." /LENGTH=116 /DNA_ID=CAMNT_0048016831 /DNA_START=24 /DNA_END=374 /DNA_ORIENTATION=+